MKTLSILLQATEGSQTGTSSWSGILMMVLIFVVFYFFMIRPQSKRQKEIRKFQDSLAAGQRVMTSGGIYGVIRQVKEDVVHVEIADKVTIKVVKSMVYASPEEAKSQEVETPAEKK